MNFSTILTPDFQIVESIQMEATDDGILSQEEE
jgi:hypothetical protein